MPNIDLHCHLDGSFSIEHIKKTLNLPIGDDELKSKLTAPADCQSLAQYLTCFDIPISCLQTKEHIKQATYELFEDLAKQNVIYAEVRFAPSKHLEKGLNYNEVVEAAIKGMEEAKKDFGIDGSLILCVMRGEKTRENIKENYMKKAVTLFLTLCLSFFILFSCNVTLILVK